MCAENGNATHLISYDPHLLDLIGENKKWNNKLP